MKVVVELLRRSFVFARFISMNFKHQGGGSVFRQTIRLTEDKVSTTSSNAFEHRFTFD
jgi:hypothetical protein